MSSAFSNTRAATEFSRRGHPTLNNDQSRNVATLNGPTKLTRATIGGYGADSQARRRDVLRQASQSPAPSPRLAQLQVRGEVMPRRGSLSAPRLETEQTRISWSPQASLISSSTAPLASRISVPPLSSFTPKDVLPISLGEMTPDQQEDAILEDILFVFMGFEGQYIRFAETYNPLEEKDRLAGPDFRILAGLDPSLRDLALSMLKIAKYFIALEAFIEVQSREEFGSVNHALCASIRKILKDYLILVAQLEHQFLTNDSFTLHLMNLHTKPTNHMLFQLYSVAHEILKKNALLEEDDDESDSLDDVDDIIETLREGGEVGGLAGKKICKGGHVLRLITQRLSTLAGDPAARNLLTTLLQDASKPYMVMLNEWLHRGSIKDPHAEFLIKEQKSIRREGLEQDYTDEYWEKRYTVREADIPPQLESLKDKVLLAGKYLNVVRECGGVDVSKEVSDVPITFDDPRFLENVNSAYAHANASLLSLLLHTHSLPARLRSLKHYFFLDRSDFFSYFLELSNSELRKPAKSVNTGKLQSLLEIVLRQPGTVAAEDPYKEDVKVQMSELSLTNWLMRIVNVTGLDQDAVNTSMTNLLTPAAAPINDDDSKFYGFDAFTLDFSVPFPLSLVISRVTLTRYQLLFRYLLSLKHLEILLSGSWTEHMKSMAWRHRSKSSKLEEFKRKAWTLRARMLVFVQQLLYFSTAEVIEPNWQSLMLRINSSESQGGGLGPSSSPPGRTVDELMQDHIDFLATCLKECMLTNSRLLRINSKVMGTCAHFAHYTAKYSKDLAAADPASQTKKTPAHTRPASTNSITVRKHGRNASSAANRQMIIQPIEEPVDESKLDKMLHDLSRFEVHFSKHLKILLDALDYLAATETVVFVNLCARLSAAKAGSGQSNGPGAVASDRQAG